MCLGQRIVSDEAPSHRRSIQVHSQNLLLYLNVPSEFVYNFDVIDIFQHTYQTPNNCSSQQQLPLSNPPPYWLK